MAGSCTNLGGDAAALSPRTGTLAELVETLLSDRTETEDTPNTTNATATTIAINVFASVGMWFRVDFSWVGRGNECGIGGLL
jgi:hypothetical protein